MNPIRTAVEQYLQLRRTLGFKLEAPAALLRSFVRYLEKQNFYLWLLAPTGNDQRREREERIVATADSV